MAGFVPGRDRFTIEALHPEEAEHLRALDKEEHQAALDKEELAELEHEQTGAPAPAQTEGPRSLLDRLMRRR